MGSPVAAARSLRLPALLRGPAAGWRRASVHSAPARRKLRSIDDLPGPRATTTLYWLFVKGYADKSHLLQQVQRGQYGPLWRSSFGPLVVVNVAAPPLLAALLQQEGLHPIRALLPHWREYRQLRGQAPGLHVDTGPSWLRLRRALNPRLLKLGAAAAYAPVLLQVVEDLLQRIHLLRRRSTDGQTVHDITAELYKFGFEGTAAILFETRLGCLQEEVPSSTLGFISAVSSMLTLSERVVLLPRWSRALLPYWDRFVSAWDQLHHVAQTLIDRRVCELEAQVRGGGTVEGMYLTHLLSSNQLSRAEIYTCITELLLGGVDTTSNTLAWALYRLALDPPAQRRLQAEVDRVCPQGRQPTVDDLSRMPYLKAVVKETLRLYPVVPGNGRFISENEVILDDYWFPKETQFHLCHYAVSHDEAQFPDPERFLPERWLRAEAPPLHHPYSFLPFGVGVRGCVGKRVAELEMHFALSMLLQRYELQPADSEPVEPRTRTLLVPGGPINLRFLSRQTDQSQPSVP